MNKGIPHEKYIKLQQSLRKEPKTKKLTWRGQVRKVKRGGLKSFTNLPL
ncbi:hypothetical protein BSG1_16085 [Bacillus sp. SG-1]|nr:hypothetical protein BSG1_16085 [Bacillus sp. SG-1]